MRLRSSVAALTLLSACAGSRESEAVDSWERFRELRAEQADVRVELDGTLASYVTYAMARSPELEASFQRYRAAILAIAPRRRLPEPMISYGYFVRSVETRVGPQRHRISIRQDLPWPGRLTSGADAQAELARARERELEAASLALAKRVADAYWRLWLVRRSHQLLLEQEAVFDTLAGSVEARMAVGGADLADLGQLHLRLERLRDHRGTHHEEGRAAAARLVAAIGAPPGTATPMVDTPPELGLPAAEEEALLAAAIEHPRIDAYEHMAAASEERADAEAAAGFPMLSLGADYIETGEATHAAGVQDSGKDPIIVSIGMTLPIWFGAYSDAADSARAEAAAIRAERESAEQRAAAELAEALARVNDTYRRVALHERTLLPQADTVLGSTLGSYQTGRGSIADVLLAVRELLDIQLERERVLAAHATAWAELEHVVGRAIERRRPEVSP